MLVSNAARTFVAGAGILIPLYIFPGDPPSCSAWEPLFTAMSSFPEMLFTIVVNPASGPGAQGSQPSTSYQGCIPLLRRDNGLILGYVPTGANGVNGARDEADVEADIDTYAGWASDYKPEGIFFDQVSGTAADLQKYSDYMTLTRQSFSFNGGNGMIALNPGTPPDTDYFTVADIIVTAETFFSDFSPSQLQINFDTSPAGQQAVLLHDSPSSSPTSLVNSLMGVGSPSIAFLYVTDDTFATGDDDPYDSFPTFWTAFVQDVANAIASHIVSG